MYVHHLHPIVWDFFSSYKQSFLSCFVYVSACQRSASDCLSALLLLLPHPVYRSAMTAIASRLLTRTSHSTSGCFSDINLCRLSGAKRLPSALMLQAAFTSTKFSFCFLRGPNLFSCPLCENTAGSYLLSDPLQRASTDTQMKSEKALLPLQSQACEASQWAASLSATERVDKNLSVPGVHCLSDSEAKQGQLLSLGKASPFPITCPLPWGEN